MFRCNLTNGRGKTNLFDVELLLIVNATAEFSLFLCANNYSRELSATFVFLPPFSSPLLVHVLLLPPVFDVSLRPREISMTEINAIYTSVPFCFARYLFLTIIARKINRSTFFFTELCTRWTRFLLVTRYLKQYYPERIIVDQTVSFRFMTTNRKID